MDKIEDILNQAETIYNLSKGFKLIFSNFLQNKNISLSIRWDAFLDYSILFLSNYNYKVIELQTLKNIHFNKEQICSIDKEPIIDFACLIYEIKDIVSETELNMLKEEILETGYIGYINK